MRFSSGCRGRRSRALARAGVGWVVVESGGGTASSGATGGLPGWRPDGVPGRRGLPGCFTPAVLIAAHLVWLAMLVLGAAGTMLWTTPLTTPGMHRLQYRAHRVRALPPGEFAAAGLRLGAELLAQHLVGQQPLEAATSSSWSSTSSPVTPSTMESVSPPEDR